MPNFVSIRPFEVFEAVQESHRLWAHLVPSPFSEGIRPRPKRSKGLLRT